MNLQIVCTCSICILTALCSWRTSYMLLVRTMCSMLLLSLGRCHQQVPMLSFCKL